VPGPIDYGLALERTVQQNISLLPSLEDLATRSTELYSRLMETAYPGITNLRNLGTQQIGSFLRGEIPEDVSRQLRRISAEQSAGAGTSGSPFSKALEARDLGLTSLSLIQGGLGAAERWIAQAKSQTFDFSRMFFGPEDTQRQAEMEWQRQWLEAQVAAAPDPTARGQFDTGMAVIGMVLSAYGGGAGYQGTYRPSYGNVGGGAVQGGMGGAAAGSYFGEYNPGPDNFGRGNEVDFSSDYGNGGGLPF
jgi:hypothetical protein